MPEITNEFLQTCGINDFRLMPNEEHLVLILMFPDQNRANAFLAMLQTNPFTVRFLKGQEERHVVEIIFTVPQLVLRWESTRTEGDYPVIGRLHMGINHITTGFKDNEGVKSNYVIIPLDLLNNYQ